MDGLNSEDREFLRRVAAAAREGRTQQEIAEAVGLKTPGALHGRINRLGHRLRAVPRTELLETVTGRVFEECETCAAS